MATGGAVIKLPAAVELGRRGGAVASEAQKAAARENGTKSKGRPVCRHRIARDRCVKCRTKPMKGA